MPHAAALASQIQQALLRHDVHRAPLGCWTLQQRCVLISHPSAPLASEPSHAPDGRPRFASGHWLTPHFVPSGRLRHAVRDASTPLLEWAAWERSVLLGLRAGVALPVPGVGHLTVTAARGIARPCFRFAASFRHRIGADQARLLGLRSPGDLRPLAGWPPAH